MTHERFYEVLGSFVDRSAYTSGQLSRLTGIPKQTIVAWREGRVKRPRNQYDLLKLAAAFRLTESEANRFLQSAGHPMVTNIIQKAQIANNTELLSLTAIWLQFRQQQSQETPPPPFQAPPNNPFFIGREKLGQTVSQALQSNHKISILQGMGGVGKTALAKKLAYDLRPKFPDGVLWVTFFPTTREGSSREKFIFNKLGQIAHSFGRDVREDGDISTRTTLVRDLLGNKEALLILDNAESSADVIPFLPPTGSKTAVLITTRNKRMLSQTAVSFDVLPFNNNESYLLLQKIIGQKRIQEEHQGARQIIKLLAGLPLALKIVGSDLDEAESLTLLEYHELLADERTRLENLSDWEDTSKDVRSTFELSYKRLSPQIQSLFNKLSIFTSNTFRGLDFSFEAVAAIFNIPKPQLKKYLYQLQSLSLLEINSLVWQSGGAQDDRGPAQIQLVDRYRLHPLLRLFAQEKAADSQESYAKLFETAARYYANFAHKHQNGDFSQIDLDWDNIWGALEWAYQNEQWHILEKGAQAITHIHLGVIGFVDVRGNWAEGQQLLKWLGKMPELTSNPVELAYLKLKAGVFALRQADHGEAERKLQQSLAALNGVTPTAETAVCQAYASDFMAQLMIHQDPQAALKYSNSGVQALKPFAEQNHHEMGYLYIRHASILGQTRQIDEAKTAVVQGLNLLPQTPSSARVSGHMNLGILELLSGNSEAAISSWKTGIGEATALKDYRRLAGLWQNIAIQHSWNGRFSAAIEANHKALTHYQKLGDVVGETDIQANLGDDYGFIGDDKNALKHLRKALQMAQSHELPRFEAYGLVNFVRLQMKRNQLHELSGKLDKAYALCTQLEISDLIPEVWRLRTRLAIAENRLADAVVCLSTAFNTAQTRLDNGICWRIQGDFSKTMAKNEAAENAYLKSEALLQEENPFELAYTQMALGTYYLSVQKNNKAANWLKKAESLFLTLEAKREIEQLRLLRQHSEGIHA